MSNTKIENSSITYKLFFVTVFLLSSFVTEAQLPLFSDDAVSVEKGSFQTELSFGHSYLSSHRCLNTENETVVCITYGLADKTDIALSLPFLLIRENSDTSQFNVSGFSDLLLESKFVVMKKKNLSVALKPGLLLPTGAHEKKLGCGLFSGSLFGMLTWEGDKIVHTVNMGIIGNRNLCGEAKNIWHLSYAADWRLKSKVHWIFNAGMEQCADPAETAPDLIFLPGFYIELPEDILISAGYMNTISGNHPCHSFIYGLTFKF